MTAEHDPYDQGARHYWECRWEGTPQAGNGSATDGTGRAFLIEKTRELLAEGCKTILDIGCGATNQWGPSLPCPEADYTGIDISEVAISYAIEKHPNAWFGQVDMASLEAISDNIAADLVICTDMLQHIRPQDYLNVLQRIRYLTRKSFLIRCWFDHPEWHGAGGYHFNHDEPVSDNEWDIQKFPSPEGTFHVYIGRRKTAQQDV